MKSETQDVERERLVTLKQLDSFGLNPFAFWQMIESYIATISPEPIKFIWMAPGKDEKMDKAAQSVGVVELYIMTAGYVGKKVGDLAKLDSIATRLVCQSYYQNIRPLPCSLQVLNAVEVHIRTPGESDYDGKGVNKNPFKDHAIIRAIEKDRGKT